MEPSPPLATLTTDQLRQRSRVYRDMAATVTTVEIRDALIRLAVRFAILAVTRDGTGKAGKRQNPCPTAGDAGGSQ